MTLYQRAKRGGMRLYVRGQQFGQTPRGQRVIKALRYVLTAAILAYLAYQLASIGWANLWTSLPRTPWFYVLFAGMYVTLPVFQAVIFGLLWSVPPPEVFPAALKKRVYDKDVLSYSGDVFLYFWARRRTGLSDGALLHSIKDNTIVSAIVSTLLAVGLLAVFFFSGLMEVPAFIRQHSVAYAVGAVVVGIVVVALGARFRRAVFKAGGRTLMVLAALHLARILIVQGLQVVQWSVVLPEVPVQVWFTYLAVQIVVGRIPLLPSRDLIFVSAGIGLAGALQVPEAAVAGMLGVHSMLDKACNLLLFGAVSWINRRSAARPEGDPVSRSEEIGASQAASANAEEAASRADTVSPPL